MSLSDAFSGLIAYSAGGLAGSVVGGIAMIAAVFVSSGAIDAGAPDWVALVAFGLAGLLGLYALGWTTNRVSD
jgi:hypothetical protein